MLSFIQILYIRYIRQTTTQLEKEEIVSVKRSRNPLSRRALLLEF